MLLQLFQANCSNSPHAANIILTTIAVTHLSLSSRESFNKIMRSANKVRPMKHQRDAKTSEQQT